MHAPFYDPEVIKEAGQAIGNAGGFIAMQALFYAMVNFGPLFKDREATYAAKRCERYWNGIHGWEY